MSDIGSSLGSMSNDGGMVGLVCNVGGDSCWGIGAVGSLGNVAWRLIGGGDIGKVPNGL